MKDRVVQYPNRYKLTLVGGTTDTYDMEAVPGTVSEAGTPLNKEYLDKMLSGVGTTAGTGTALTLAQDGFALVDGVAVRFKLHTDMAKGATLSVAGTTACPIVDALGKPQKAIAGSYITVVYSSTTGDFILQGNGGGQQSKFGNEVGQISSFELFVLGKIIALGE